VLLVAITGYGQDGDRRRSREAGFDVHLTKPIDPDVLDALLANAGA
jgi:CheY-like chemotaxis protein